MSDFFEQSEVMGVLRGYNPWWSGQEFEVPSFRRLAYHACRRFLDDRSIRRAVLLSGPRRVGKTTILTQIAKGLLQEGRDPKSIFYVSLDHPLLKLLSLPEILQIYHATLFPEGQQATLLLDEVQYCSDWELQLKQLVDHKSEYRIVATGSASVVHRQRLAESGVGRWVSVPVPTLSFYEFIQIRQEAPPAEALRDLRPSDLCDKRPAELAQVATALRTLLPLFVRYLVVGGFPETAMQQDISLCQRLLREDVVERVLKRDMTALFGVRNVNDLEKLFIYLCLHSGNILSVSSCANALGVTAPTVSNHLAALEQANLIYRLPPFQAGGKKVLKSRYKVYLVDAALRNAVLLRGEEILDRPEELGTVVETSVLRHLYAYHYRDTPRICYWRDSASGREVDIIVSSPSYTVPVEVKYRESSPWDDQAGLVEFCRQEKPLIAYIVTKQDSAFELRRVGGLPTKFLMVPAHIFTYLLGQAERLLWKA